MIFFILLQVQIDSLYSETKSLYFREIQPPEEVIRIYDSTFNSVLNSIDTTEKDDVWRGLFFQKLRYEIERNESLLNFAERMYIEKGEWLYYYTPLPLGDFRKAREVLRDLKIKRNKHLYKQRLSKLEDSLLKKNLEEYYKYKDGVSIWYEKIPEEMAVDEDFVYLNELSYGLYRGICCWYSRANGEWSANILQPLNPKDSLFIGYFSLLKSHTDSTGCLFLLKRDSLKQITTDTLYIIQQYPLEENIWAVMFKYNSEKDLWNTYPNFVPLYFNPFAKGNKNADFLSFINKSLSKIEENANIKGTYRIGSFSKNGDEFVWWATDKFSGLSYEKIKVNFYCFPSPIDNFPSPYFFYRKAEASEDSVVTCEVIYYKLPWVDKPEIKSVNGISFFVKPTRNPIYKTIHMFYVIGLTLKNICLKTVRFFRNIFLTWPFFSSYIWTFVFIAGMSFLIGFGIFKIKAFVSRRS